MQPVFALLWKNGLGEVFGQTQFANPAAVLRASESYRGPFMPRCRHWGLLPNLQGLLAAKAAASQPQKEKNFPRPFLAHNARGGPDCRRGIHRGRPTARGALLEAALGRMSRSRIFSSERAEKGSGAPRGSRVPGAIIGALPRNVRGAPAADGLPRRWVAGRFSGPRGARAGRHVLRAPPRYVRGGPAARRPGGWTISEKRFGKERKWNGAGPAGAAGALAGGAILSN